MPREGGGFVRPWHTSRACGASESRPGSRTGGGMPSVVASMATSRGSCHSCSGMTMTGWCSNGEVSVMSAPVGLAPVISRGAHLVALLRLSTGSLLFPGDLPLLLWAGCVCSCFLCFLCSVLVGGRPPDDGARARLHGEPWASFFPFLRSSTLFLLAYF